MNQLRWLFARTYTVLTVIIKKHEHYGDYVKKLGYNEEIVVVTFHPAELLLSPLSLK